MRIKRVQSLQTLLGKKKKRDLIKMVISLQGSAVKLVSSSAKGRRSNKPIWPTYTRKTKWRGRGSYAKHAKRTEKGWLKKWGQSSAYTRKTKWPGRGSYAKHAKRTEKGWLKKWGQS